jgi:MarR family transcriptional regulator, organic hydroperoxide resistance regulator
LSKREAAKRAAARSTGPSRTGKAQSKAKEFVSPATVTLPTMLENGNDLAFRETIYLMALAFDRLHSCREAFGRALALTASQFIVLIGTAHRQGQEGVTIRALAEHTQLAATHVTTEVGRLIDKGLLVKETNSRDRRSVLVRLSAAGETAIRDVNPLLRRVNDRLFQNVTRGEFDVVSRFFAKFARNSEEALFELRRAEHRA